MAIAAGNAAPPSPAGDAYNVISVNAFRPRPTFATTGPSIDGRSKPDITAPAISTSFSTPLAAGVATLLVEAAQRPPLIDRASAPETIKALLLNGAIKPRYEVSTAYNWSHTGTAPLDIHHGAGVVNAFNSYKQFAGGKHPFITTSTGTQPPLNNSNIGALSGWDFQTIATPPAATDVVNHYFFELTGPEGSWFTLTSTLTWLRHLDIAGINNLDLYLYKADGTPVDASESTIDNVEHLFAQALPPGRYDLEVVKRADGRVSDEENYSLAWNFARNQLSGVVSRKVHGAAGPFDVPLPISGPPGVECRGNANGTHQVIFSFAVPIPSVTSADFFWSDETGGHVCPPPPDQEQTCTAALVLDGYDVVANLTGVPNAQTITVVLRGVNDGVRMDDVGVKMGVLLGDVNADRVVNAADVLLVRNRSGLNVDQDRFRADVNADGFINSGDATAVRNKSGSSLP